MLANLTVQNIVSQNNYMYVIYIIMYNNGITNIIMVSYASALFFFCLNKNLT